MELPYTKYNLFERRRVESLGREQLNGNFVCFRRCILDFGCKNRRELVLALDCVGAGSDSPLIFHKLERARHKRPSP